MLAPGGAGWCLVRDFAEHPVTAGVRHFATQTGGRVAGEGIVAWTSDQAWADAGAVPLYGEGDMGLFGDMRYSDSEEQGKQGIILARGVGLGRVTVIADQNGLGDAFISYADNWRLWLNACKWCGQFQWDDSDEQPLSDTVNITSPQPNQQAADSAADGRGPAASAAADELAREATFEQIVASEPDRNQAPAVARGAWAIHCWEPLEDGSFHWGGTGPEQYYYFWCWMNRWFWVAANDQPRRPREHAGGRPMLIAVASDSGDERLIGLARQTLDRHGKVILLPEKDLAIADKPSEEDLRQAARAAKSFFDTDGALKLETAQWSTEPIAHWRIDAAAGTLVIIATAQSLRNANFSQPEIAPGPAVLKRENELRQWLFEQP
jgi:hypothetical protein